MNPFLNKLRVRQYFLIAEHYLRDSVHIGSSMMLTNFLLARNKETQKPLKLIDEEQEKTQKELDKLVKALSLQVFNLKTDQSEEIDLDKSDYDYIKSRKIHFLEYQEYKHDVDLINMDEVESVDLDEIGEEFEQYQQIFASDLFSQRETAF